MKQIISHDELSVNVSIPKILKDCAEKFSWHSVDIYAECDFHTGVDLRTSLIEVPRKKRTSICQKIVFFPPWRPRFPSASQLSKQIARLSVKEVIAGNSEKKKDTLILQERIIDVSSSPVMDEMHHLKLLKIWRVSSFFSGRAS